MRASIAVLALVFVYAGAVSPDLGVTYRRDHATDAVRWQAWGKAALDQARHQQKPIALAVGAFGPHGTRLAHDAIESDAATVKVLNEVFVPVLVDRAEQPRLARAFAAAAGRTPEDDFVVHVLTPDLEWLASSADPRSLGLLSQRWSTNRDAFLEDSRLTVRRLRLHLNEATASTANDPDPDALRALDRSARHDVLGGGFFRAVREDATLPFYDKTLDDQARLAMLYLQASQNDPHFADVARDTLEYAVRDLQMRDGGFNDSQQADSLVPVGKPVIVEGAFYLWDRAELLHVFGPKLGAGLIEQFGLLPEGKSLPRIARSDAPDPVTAAAIAKMLDIRLKRPEPRRDDPVAASHARMTSALARGGRILDDERFVRAAIAGGAYLERTFYDRRTGRLWRRPIVPAGADDYAAAVGAFIDLYQATLEPKWLDLALALQSQQDSSFWNAAARRYEDGTAVPETVRDFILTAAVLVPLNAASEFNLLRLAAITGRTELTREIATKPVTRVIIFGRTNRADTAALLRAAYTGFDLSRVIVYGGVVKRGAPGHVGIGSLRPNEDGTASAYICRASGCSDAFGNPAALANALR